MAKVARVMAKVARVMATKAMLLINFILTVGKIRRGSEGLFGVWCWELEEQTASGVNLCPYKSCVTPLAQPILAGCFRGLKCASQSELRRREESLRRHCLNQDNVEHVRCA